MSGVAEAIGRVPAVAAATVAGDEDAVLEGLVLSAAPAVEGPAPGAAERGNGGVVAVAGVADARCTVVPGADHGDGVAGLAVVGVVGVVEGDGGVVRRLSGVLSVPAAGVPRRVMACAAGADAVVAAGVVTAGVVGAGVVGAGVVAVRGGAAEVRGRRCTAAGPLDGDVADGPVVDVVDSAEEVDVLDLVGPLRMPDVPGVLPGGVGPPDVDGGVDGLAGREVADLRLGVVLGVARSARGAGGCCGE